MAYWKKYIKIFLAFFIIILFGKKISPFLFYKYLDIDNMDYFIAITNMTFSLLVLIFVIKEKPSQYSINNKIRLMCFYIILVLFYLCYLLQNIYEKINVYIKQTTEFINVHSVINIKQLSALVLVLCIFPSIIEELFFRYYIYTELKEQSKFMVIIISTILFSLSHSGISVLTGAMLGMVLMIIYIKTQSLSLVISLHCFYNILFLLTEYVFAFPSDVKTFVYTNRTFTQILASAFGNIATIFGIISVHLFFYIMRYGKEKLLETNG